MSVGRTKPKLQACPRPQYRRVPHETTAGSNGLTRGDRGVHIHLVQPPPRRLTRYPERRGDLRPRDAGPARHLSGLTLPEVAEGALESVVSGRCGVVALDACLSNSSSNTVLQITPLGEVATAMSTDDKRVHF